MIVVIDENNSFNFGEVFYMNKGQKLSVELLIDIQFSKV